MVLSTLVEHVMTVALCATAFQWKASDESMPSVLVGATMRAWAPPVTDNEVRPFFSLLVACNTRYLCCSIAQDGVLEANKEKPPCIDAPSFHAAGTSKLPYSDAGRRASERSITKAVDFGQTAARWTHSGRNPTSRTNSLRSSLAPLIISPRSIRHTRTCS